MKRFAFSAVFFVLLTASAIASEPLNMPSIKSWTHVNGNSAKLEMYRFSNGNVTFRTLEGKYWIMPISDLVEADQKIVVLLNEKRKTEYRVSTSGPNHKNNMTAPSTLTQTTQDEVSVVEKPMPVEDEAIENEPIEDEQMDSVSDIELPIESTSTTVELVDNRCCCPPPITTCWAPAPAIIYGDSCCSNRCGTTSCCQTTTCTTTTCCTHSYTSCSTDCCETCETTCRPKKRFRLLDLFRFRRLNGCNSCGW
ncbi:MAG: hypothetical protein AAGA30_21985 [Planctomycetota bacterium]